MKTIIHVNQHKVRRNNATSEREPVITVKTYKSNDYAHHVIIDGPSAVKYRPDNPLKCGAKCWIETDSDVVILS